MSLLFEYAQSVGYDMDIFFSKINLQLSKLGSNVYGEQFHKAIKEDEILSEISICQVLPTQVLECLLNLTFDSCECDSYIPGLYGEYHEGFEITDELFQLITSGEYLNAKSSNDLDEILSNFGLICSDDLGYFVDSEQDDEVDYLELESLAEVIKNCFTKDTFVFQLYYTEQIYEVGYYLVELKRVLMEIKEELNEYNNHERVAA